MDQKTVEGKLLNISEISYSLTSDIAKVNRSFY